MLYLRSLVATAVLISTSLASPTASPSSLTWKDDHANFADSRRSLLIDDEAISKRQISPSTWNPPSNLVTPLQQVWDHETQTYNMNFQNFGFDQLIAANGNINICVRWESSTAVTRAQRDAVEVAYRRSYLKWMNWLYGFDGFPYSSVNVKVVGWAVTQSSLLQGDTSNIDVYTGTDSEGAPQCAPACGRFFHQDNNYNQCPGGAARHYDHSLWLTDGFGGGAGGDWGQRIGREYFMGAINTENIHILLHEMGHTYALDDFYDWTPSGVGGFIMQAGSATQITDFDGWVRSCQQDCEDAKAKAILDAARLVAPSQDALQPFVSATHNHLDQPDLDRSDTNAHQYHDGSDFWVGISTLWTMRWDRVDRPYDVRAGYLQGCQ